MTRIIKIGLTLVEIQLKSASECRKSDHDCMIYNEQCIPRNIMLGTSGRINFERLHQELWRLAMYSSRYSSKVQRSSGANFYLCLFGQDFCKQL